MLKIARDTSESTFAQAAKAAASQEALIPPDFDQIVVDDGEAQALAGDTRTEGNYGAGRHGVIRAAGSGAAAPSVWNAAVGYWMKYAISPGRFG